MFGESARLFINDDLKHAVDIALVENPNEELQKMLYVRNLGKWLRDGFYGQDVSHGVENIVHVMPFVICDFSGTMCLQPTVFSL